MCNTETSKSDQSGTGDWYLFHGENRGKKDCILYMFYLSQKDLPLAVQHPDIPLE